MPATKSTPAGAKAAAARAERNGGSLSCEWLGLKLKLPAKLPATFAFDAAEIETADGIAPLFNCIRGVIGPEQFAAVRERVAEKKIPLEDFDDVLSELLDAVFGAYGVSLGEASASADS